MKTKTVPTHSLITTSTLMKRISIRKPTLPQLKKKPNVRPPIAYLASLRKQTSIPIPDRASEANIVRSHDTTPYPKSLARG